MPDPDAADIAAGLQAIARAINNLAASAKRVADVLEQTEKPKRPQTPFAGQAGIREQTGWHGPPATR
jgi:hypothetical protein